MTSIGKTLKKLYGSPLECAQVLDLPEILASATCNKDFLLAYTNLSELEKLIYTSQALLDYMSLMQNDNYVYNIKHLIYDENPFLRLLKK